MVNAASKISCLSLITTLFAITAFCLMWAGSIRCNIIKFDSAADPEGSSVELGLWYYSSYSLLFSEGYLYGFESCNSYPSITKSELIDPTWKTAQAFSIITFILATIAMIASCVASSVATRSDREGERMKLTNAWESPLYLLVAICQGLVLLILGSNACDNKVLVGLVPFRGGANTFDDTCSVSTGGKLIISATAFWFGAFVTGFLAHRTEKCAETAADEEKESKEVAVDTDKPEQDVPEQAKPVEAA